MTVDIPARVDTDHTLRRIVELHQAGCSPEQIIERLGRTEVETAVRAFFDPVAGLFADYQRRMWAAAKAMLQVFKPVIDNYVRLARQFAEQIARAEAEARARRPYLRRMHTMYGKTRRARKGRR